MFQAALSLKLPSRTYFAEVNQLEASAKAVASAECSTLEITGVRAKEKK